MLALLQRISVSMLATAALMACGKKVVNPGDIKAALLPAADQSGDATPGGSPGQSGDAAGRLGTSTATASGAAVDQQDIDDLHDLIDKEREERIAADQELHKQIDALTINVQRLEVSIGVDITVLDKFSKQIQSQMDDQIKAAADALAELQSKLNAADAELAKKFREEVAIDIAKIRELIPTSTPEQKAEHELLIAELEKKLGETDAKLAADLRAEMAAKMVRIDIALTAFKAEAQATYATKAELQVLAAAIDAIKGMLPVTTEKFENTLRELSEKLAEEQRVAMDALQAQIDDIKTDAQDLKVAVAKLSTELDAKVLALRTELTADLAAIRLEIAQLQEQDAVQIASIRALSTRLDEKAEHLFRFFSALNAELTARIDRLQQEVEALPEDQRALVQAQIAVLDAKLNQLANEERDARAALSAQIQQIVQQIQALDVFARESRNLIVANRDNIERDRLELERLRETMRREIEHLNGDFSSRLSEVKQLAIAITVALGTSVQQQFVTLNAQIATLNQRINSQVEMILMALVDMIGRDEQVRRPIQAFLAARTQPLAETLHQLGYDRVALENELINLVGPFTPAGGVNPTALNQEFRTLLATNTCGGFAGTGDQPASLAGREWFTHIAGEYVLLLATGVRSGSEAHDKIFYGLAGSPPVQDSIAGTMLASILGSYSTGSACQRVVTAWARAKFLGTDAQAVAIRTAIAASLPLKARATALIEKLNAYRTLAAGFDTDLLAALAAAGRDVALIKTWLFNMVEGIRPVDRIVAYLLDSVEDFRQLAEHAANRDRIFALARTVAAQQEALGQVTRSVAQLDLDFAALKEKVSLLSQVVFDAKAALASLRESQLVAFDLIAAIAGRLGFQDIVDRADDEIENLGGTAGVRVKDGCYAVQHFYNHATNPNLPVARCQSLMTTPDKTLSDLELSRCAIHGGFSQGADLIAYTWGNETLVHNGWAARGANVSGHRVDDGLLIRQIDPGQAKQLAARGAGSAYPADRESTLVYRVLGNATKLKFEVTSEANAGRWPYAVTVDANEYLKGQTQGLNIYEVPLPKAIGKLGACTWNRQVKVTALSAQGAAAAKTCQHRFHTFSPIVLNLAGAGMITTVPPTDSPVWFDLDANGIRERTGWVHGDSALLARDLNGNGRIDDGAELFGEATQVDGQRATNGYAALAALDHDRNGQLDAKDPAFADLIVWKDINGDGVSQAFELRSAQALGLSSIAVTYKKVDEAAQLHADAAQLEANLIKYRSTFQMPGCGSRGCATFDVYFGSSEYTATTAAK